MTMFLQFTGIFPLRMSDSIDIVGGRAQGPPQQQQQQQQPPQQQQQQQQQQQPVQNIVYPPQHVQQQQMQPARREATNDYSALFVALIGSASGCILSTPQSRQRAYMLSLLVPCINTVPGNISLVLDLGCTPVFGRGSVMYNTQPKLL